MPKKSSARALTQQQQQQQQQHLPRSSPFAGEASNPTSLVQCARRRLQYSQLPVRCSTVLRRPIQQPGRLVNSLKRFPVLGTPKRCVSAKSCCQDDGRYLKSQSSPTARKSMSLIDLSPGCGGAGDCEHGEMRSDSGSTSARLEDASDRRTEETLSTDSYTLTPWGATRCITYFEDELEARESRAASLICRALAINAWRHKRSEVTELRVALTDLNQQIDHLQIQIVVLRKLLDKENERVGNLAGELHRTKAHLDDVTKERDQLRIEKNTAEGEAQKQREISEERLVTAENLRNELKSARDQLDGLDKQISKDREKLLKLREDKKILLEKVSASESLAADRGLRADKAELSLEDTQMQLATQIALTNSLQEEVQRFLNALKEKEDEKSELEKTLRKMEEENIKVEERLRVSEETEKVLSTRSAELESQLVDRESKIKSIEAAYCAQVTELSELRERLMRQSRESCWSSKVLQLAGSVVRAPRVILRTLSFFSTGMPLIL